jgi:hypothetical protein
MQTGFSACRPIATPLTDYGPALSPSHALQGSLNVRSLSFSMRGPDQTFTRCSRVGHNHIPGIERLITNRRSWSIQAVRDYPSLRFSNGLGQERRCLPQADFSGA